WVVPVPSRCGSSPSWQRRPRSAGDGRSCSCRVTGGAGGPANAAPCWRTSWDTCTAAASSPGWPGTPARRCRSFIPCRTRWAARLRLEQELAADAWGARLSGGKSSYLATLAQMALRRDGRAVTWPARAFLPSHGTFVRRIDMLRKSKPLRRVSLSIGARVLTVGVLAAMGLLGAGLRGPAGGAPAAAHDQPGDPAP